MMKRKIKIALLACMCRVCIPTLYAAESPWSFGIKTGFHASYMQGFDKADSKNVLFWDMMAELAQKGQLGQLGQKELLKLEKLVKRNNAVSWLTNVRYFVRYKGSSRWGISLEGGLIKHVGTLQYKFNTSERVYQDYKEDENKPPMTLFVHTHNLSIRKYIDLYPLKLDEGHWCISPGIELSFPIRKRLLQRLNIKFDKEDTQTTIEFSSLNKGIRSFDIAAVLRTEYAFASGVSLELWGSYGFLDRIQKSNGAEDKGDDDSKGSAGKQLRDEINLKDEDTFHQVGFGFSLGYNIAKGFKLAQMECPIKDDPAYSW